MPQAIAGNPFGIWQATLQLVKNAPSLPLRSFTAQQKRGQLQSPKLRDDNAVSFAACISTANRASSRKTVTRALASISAQKISFQASINAAVAVKYARAPTLMHGKSILAYQDGRGHF